MSDPLAEVVTGRRPPGVYRLPCTEPVAVVSDRLAAAGWGCPVIDGRAVRDKVEFLRACQVALRLPDWFGHTWDALHDCLIDLSWLPGLGHLVLWEGAGTLLTADEQTWHTACEVFAAAAAVRPELDLPALLLAQRDVDEAGAARAGVALPPAL